MGTIRFCSRSGQWQDNVVLVGSNIGAAYSISGSQAPKPNAHRAPSIGSVWDGNEFW